MDFDSQIKAVAETYYQIYEEMTGQSAEGIDFNKIESPYAIEGKFGKDKKKHLTR